MGEEFERKLERNKDIAQELVETTAHRVGRITNIITGAVADVAREVGDLVTDGFEMRDAARRAKADQRESLSGVDDDQDEISEAGVDRQSLPSASNDHQDDIIDAEIESDDQR
ncbi:hypothetical protein HH308_22445 [Gordonia sp. TBRC 11910]|uniref:Uncharacterized protein n=1 Tax=Gordonia asplenii TaxID=2725283 RepID=A0A848L8R6_9ACTN|nr:hypothetical protein [Gordonia asplenii]NMO03978.1 hypothetical protein [Gordonia asplenii]